MRSKSPVALKFCVDAKAQEQLENERDVLDAVMRQGKHAGIVPLLRTYLSADPPCLEYEYVEGGDLGVLVQELHRTNRAAPERMNRLLLDLAGIVAFAHKLPQPVVHCDLKPANVLVQSSGGSEVLRVTDFGIGGLAADQARRDTLGTTNALTMARGSYTPLYASPQQKRGEKRDPRDDVYSLGVIWYQMLIGDLNAAAPTGDTWKERLRRQGLSGKVLALLVRCLEERAEDRPRNAAELEKGLRQALDGRPALTGRQRQRRMLLAGMGLMVGSGGLSAWAWLSRPRFESAKEDRPAVFPSGMTRDIVNSIGMKLALIPSGTFTMGSPKGEGRDNEEPQHEVEISKPFCMDIHEVMQKEFKEVMGYNPSYFSKDGKGKTGERYISDPAGGKDKVPADTSDFSVENVSWEEAKEFCEKLSALEAEKKSGRVYRLPTEAEWEYACRAGTKTKYYSGDAEDDLEKVGWYAANSGGRTHAVGEKKEANAFGLFDMHGNVWEWCADWYGSDYYKNSPKKDQESPKSGPSRVRRGGCWNYDARDCRAAYRNDVAPGYRSSIFGFRVVWAAPGTR